jgi:hypothetical protein
MTAQVSTADRLATLLQEAVGGLDRRAAHELLDAALDLAADATDAEGREGRLAQAAALALSSAAARWTVPMERSPKDWDELAERNAAQWREDAVAYMRIAPAMVPQPVIDALMFALMGLNDHQPPPTILSPLPKEAGYGRNPGSRRALEQALLTWVELRVGAGEPAGALRQQAASAVGRSVPALEKWLAEWRMRDGEDSVQAVLSVARAVGRGEARPDPIPDELLILWLFPLRLLTESWKAETRSSVIPSPADQNL